MNRTLENELSNTRSVVALNQVNESNSWKWAFQHSISRCPEPRKRIELLKMSFPTFDQSLPWTEKTNQTLENELSNTRWFRATTDRMLESSFSRVRFVFLVQGNDWSSVGKLVFKSLIRFLGSGQRLIECWKARFQEFDSFTWFRARTDRMLESSFSRVRFVFLVQGNDWSNVGKLIFKSSIRFLGSGQGLIECWKAHFQEFDSFSWFRATTDRALESSFSRVRFVFLVQGNDWSNVGKLIFKSSIRFLGSGQRLIERWKAHFQEFDSFSWFRATTDRMLESSFSRVRFVFLVQGNDWSNVGKLVFKSSIRFLGSGQGLMECWKAHFQEFDSFSWFRATTDRMLESSFSRVRFVFLVQGKDWSNVGKLVFKSSIRFLGSGQRLIECWKAHFQEFDSFSRFRATTDRALESSFSRVRFVFLVQGNDWSSVGKLIFKSSIRFLGSGQRLKGNEWSSVGKLIFKSSIRFLGSGQRLIECWKAHFQEFDSFPWFRATTDRMLESSFSRVRFVFLVQGNDWSNVGKLIFKSSIHLLGSGQRLIEHWKAHFQEFNSFTWFRATTDRMLESSFSRVRFVFLVQGNDWSNVGKLIFKSSIRFLGSGQRLIECWKAHFQEFDSFSWFRATTDRMLESSFSRVRFVFLVQSNDWSNVGKLVFKSSIRFLGSGQRLIECWKARFQEFDSFTRFRATTDRMLESSFQEFDSFSWFRATTDRMLESSFSRVRFVFLVQGKDWSSNGKLIFKSSIRLLGSGQRLIECWKARFQEFDSFSWFRATTDRVLESSFSRVRFVFSVQGNDWSNVGKLFSRVRFVFLVQGKDWSNVGKLVFKSSIRFLGSGQRLIERWKAHFQEFNSFTWFRATTDRALESSFSRVRFVFLVQGKDWSSVGKLIFKSSIRLLGSGQRLIECWKAHFQEFDSFIWFRATTDRALESSFSRVRFVFLVQGNNWSNVGKLIFKSSIRFLGSGQRLIECWKAHFQEFDSFTWFRARTDRMLESSFSRVRFVYLVQGKDRSNVGKLIFKSSIRFLGSGQRLIECWKARFQEFDSFTWFRATTDRALESSFSRVRFVFLVQGNDFKATSDRALESSFSRVRFVFLVQGNDWSSVGKLIFKSSIRFLGSGQRLIECWKARFQEFDSFTWFRATTDRALESSFSRVQFVYLVQGNDWSNVGKLFSRVRFVFLVQGNDWSSVGTLVFKSSIRFLGSGQRLIECWKARFQEFDSFTWFRATTDRMLESSFSRVRFVYLVQGNDWSNVGKLIFKSSIRFLGSGQGLIECWKAHFQEFDSFSWFRATTDRMLESSFSRVRFVFLVQGNDWSNVGKLIFKSSIRFLGSEQRLIECWKARFQEFDSFPWFRATTDRMLESSFSRVRFVFLVQGNDWSNVGKLIFKSSIRLLGLGQRLIECWKARFQEFDSFSWFRATTDRMLESSFSRVQFVYLVQGNDWSNVGKLIFKSSIRFLGSGQRLIESWKARFQEFDSFTWFRATTDRMLESSFSRVRFVFLVQGNDFKATSDRALESSFSRVRFVFLVQGNDWSSVGKLIFKSSIRFLGSGQGLIECWKAHFQEFDSFSWFRATTDRMLESSFSRVRFIYLVQGNDWSSVGKLIFKSSIHLLGSGQRLIECWKAHFQKFDSFSWFRATTDRMLESSFSRVRFVFLVQGNDFKATTDRALESSFSRVRFVFLVQGNDWSSVGKLIFKSSIRFLGSGQRLIECWKARFEEFDSFSWFRATTDRMLESSFSRVRFVFLVQGNDWSNVGKLVFKSSIRLLGSGQRLIECWKALFKSSIRFLGSGQRLIECWKARFQEFDSFSWFRARTDRAMESSFSRVQFVYLVQGNDWSNVGKLVFKSSIRFLGSGQRLIECWKARFQEFDSFSRFRATTDRMLESSFQEFDSFSWFRARTDRMLESSFSRVRFVFLVQGNDWSSVGKLIFKSSIRLLGSGQRLIERWKARFQEFDSFSWFRARTDRVLESSFSRVQFVYLVQGNDWSNVGKLIFKSSIRLFGSGQRLIERWKAHFQEFDSFSWFRATTDRMLESSFSRVRFVFLVQGNDWSNVGKLIFKSSIRLLGSGQGLIECWKARFQEFDSFTWFRARTDRMLESSFSRVRFVFLVQGNDWSNVGKLVFKSSIRFLGSGQRLQGNEWSSVGKLIFKSSIRFLGSGQRLIECWKAHFQEFDSFSWFRATTDRMLESSFSRVRFIYLVQGNDWSSVGKLIFKSSIRLLGSGQRLIECWKTLFKSSIRFLGSGQRLIECWNARFQEFDSFSRFRATTDRMLESSFSRVRFVYLVQGNDWSNVGKLIFKSSIRLLGSGQRLIECWKAHFQEFDSFSWFRARTDRMLESSFSRVRFVFLVQGNDWSNVGKLIFKSSIRFLGSGQRLIECWKAHFQEFDSFSWFRATTDRMLESSFSRVRFVSLVQGNDWSNVGKLVFKSSIRFLGSGQRLIECWKAHFQEFNSFTWFRATTDRMLESSFSRVRFVFLVQGNDWSNVGKLIFKSSIRLLGSGQRLIECWKAHFQEFDSFSWFRATTDRELESSFSRVRFVYLVQGNDWSNVGKLVFKSSIRFLGSGQRLQGNEWSSVGKLIFKSSIRFLGSGQRLIECWKAHFQEFDSFSWFRARTDRMLESSFSRVRFVFLVQGNDWSNVGKLIFKSSIHLLGSGQRLIERWKAHFQEFDSFTWFRATTHRMLESSFSRVRFVFLVQGNDWSNVGKLIFKSSIRFLGSGQRLQGNDWSSVGKLIFKSSIRFLGSGQRLIECWKAHFQEFDSFSWFRATTDRMLESSFWRVRFVFLVQGNDWSNVGKLVLKSSIRFLGSGQRLIECWKARFQEFDSFSWFRATTDRVLESSFSRVRFVYLVQGNDWSNVGKLFSRVRFVFLVQGNDWSNVGKLVFKSSIRFLGSGQRLIERWKAHFQEFNSFPWFRATTDRMLESSFSRVRFVFLVQGNDWSNVGKLIFKSSIRLFGSGQRLIECWKAHFQEFDSFTWFRATTDRALESSFSRVQFVFLVQGNDWSNVGKLVFKSSIRFLGSGQRLIECWKARFQEFDSFTWFRATTDRALESSFSRVRFVYLVQGNDWSNVGKLIFKSSIRFLGSWQRLIECWKAHFQEFDSFSRFRATTDRMLESSFSRVRFVFLVQGKDWSSVGKLIFKSSIHLLGSGQRLIECWKARFQEFDSFSWFRARTDRMLESSFSRVRFVFLVQGNDWSNVGKLIFKSSIRFLGSGQRLIECWKARFQEFDSFSWFRATSDRMLESSFSRVRFVFLVQGNDWSNVGKLIFKSSIRFLGSGQRLIERWKAHFQEFNSFTWFRATTDRMLESSFSRVRFVFLVQGKDWSNVGKLIFKSSIRLLGSGQGLIECWKARFQEFDSFT